MLTVFLGMLGTAYIINILHGNVISNVSIKNIDKDAGLAHIQRKNIMKMTFSSKHGYAHNCQPHEIYQSIETIPY